MSRMSHNLLKINGLIWRQVCSHTKWTHRRPKRVFTAEEYDELENGKTPKTNRVQTLEDSGMEETYINKEETVPKTTIKWKQPRARARNEADPVEFKIRPKRVKPFVMGRQRKTTFDMLETTLDEHGNLIYTKMKDNDPRVTQLLTMVKSQKDKDKDTILLEGKRLIKDALLSKCNMKYLLFSRKDDVEYLKPFLPKTGGHLYKMPYREMQLWSDLETTPGIMAVVKTPPVEEYQPASSLPITIICDNIREPGNLGTLLRTCAAVGCSQVVLSKGCVNLWDTKVLRSGAGAHFKLRIQRNVALEDLDVEGSVFIADNNIINSSNAEDGETELVQSLDSIPVIPYYSANFPTHKHIYLIVGGETLGISSSSYEFASRLNGIRLNIPLSNDVESLNVGAALGIISFEMKRQLSQIE